MKKIFALAFMFLFASFAGAVSLQNQFMILPTGTEPVSGQGTVRTYMLEGLSYMELNLYIEGMTKKPGVLYEVWLVDEQSQYKLSIGTFIPTTFGGKIYFPFKQAMVNPTVYDKIVITEEPMNDVNPAPSTMIVAMATLPGAITDTVMMKALLKGRYEVPGSNSRATGNGVFMVNTATNTVNYNLFYTGLEGGENGAHVHGFAGIGENGAVIQSLPPGAVKTGIWTYSQSDEWKILSGLTYANVHSSKFPDGEIRGQILFEL